VWPCDLSRVLVIVPAYNEEACVADVVRSVRQKGFTSVLVIDDGRLRPSRMRFTAGYRLPYTSLRGTLPSKVKARTWPSTKAPCASPGRVMTTGCLEYPSRRQNRWAVNGCSLVGSFILGPATGSS